MKNLILVTILSSLFLQSTTYAQELDSEKRKLITIEGNILETNEIEYVEEQSKDDAQIIDTSPKKSKTISNLVGDIEDDYIPLTTEERLEIIQSDENITETQKSDSIKKLQYPERASLRKTVFSNIWLGVSQSPQQEYYYCGPATVYQTFSYLKGWSFSQDQWADALKTTTSGTVGSNIPILLNLNQSIYEYWDESKPVLEYFKGSIDWTLSHNAPVILYLVPEYDTFGYSVGGHFLNVAGQNTGASQYLIVDPACSSTVTNGPSYPYYYVWSENAYKATSHRNYRIFW